MTTDAFIDLLEQRQLVASSVTRQLRAKAAQGDDRITPKSILKYLVKKELISRRTAKELLETTLVVSDKAESSILGLTPLADIDEVTAKPARPQPAKEPVSTATPAKPATPLPFPMSIDDDLFAPSAAPLARSVEDLDDEVVPLEPVEDGVAEPTKPAPGSRLRPTKSKKKSTPRKKPKKSGSGLNKNEWDSPLLLFGGGGLAVLILASVILWFLLFRESADKLLKQANEAFDRGQYPQAEQLYDAFVEKHSGHQQWSQAKVRRGMSQLWEAAESRNFAGAAKMAPEVISGIENEPAFISDADDPDGLSAAKRDLSALLTNIAAGLVEQAETAESDEDVNERIGALNTVLELASNAKYVPQKLRLDNKLQEIRDSLERIEMREQRDVDLAAALTEMDEAVKSGEPAAAFVVRARLLSNYPMLVDDKSLAAKVVDISVAEKAGIKFVESRQAAITEPEPTKIVAELALAERRGESIAAKGSLVVRLDGGLYSLNLSDGSLLWRRFVGLDGNAFPLLLPGGDVVAADSQRKELICLNAQTGKLVWRLPLEGELATPVLAGDRLLVPSDAGKLYVIEQASGELVGHVAFSQPLRMPPAVNESGDRIYVVGEHSNLYTLSGADFSCLGVYYLGHAAGGIAAPPVVVLNKVIVADNSGAETSQIRALSLNGEGAVDKQAASHRLSGLVLTPLQTAGRRVAAVTTLGQAAVFETTGDDGDAALTVLASRDAQDRDPLAQFSLLHEGHLWVAGRQLTKLAILPTGNQLPVKSTDRDYRGDAFDYPLQAAGDVIIHVRRSEGRPGAAVSAMSVEGRPIWETELAVPPAGPPAVDSNGLRITAGAASGAVYLLDREAMTSRVKNEAERLSRPQAELPLMTDSLALSQGRLVLGGVGGSTLLHFRPENPRQSLKAVTLPGPLSCPLIAWRDGFVSATNVGQITLHSAEDATPVATPFQPELTPGREYRWQQPAVVGSGTDSKLVVSDGVEKLYLVEVNPQPQLHLQATGAVDVGPSPLVTPLAVAGKRVFAGTEAGKLANYKLPDMAAGEPIDVGGRVAWGPFTAGDGVMIAVESGELLYVGADGAVRWRHPLKHGELGGAPLVDGDNALMLVPTGGVARINLSDGAEAAYAELAQPAVAGPVAFGPRLVLPAPDGTLLIVNRP